MSTAICFKSESADYYLYLSSDKVKDDLEELKRELRDQWWIEEVSYVETMKSFTFTDQDLVKIINEILEEK